MCNEFAQERAWREYAEMMQREALSIISDEPVDLPFGSIRPSERAAIFSAAPGGSAFELLPWGWTSSNRPGLIINIRSEGRRDPAKARGIAPMDRFYEFRGTKVPKSKFEFTAFGNEPLGFAVVKKDGRFALLTSEPGADVAGIHNRMPVTLRASDWRHFLTWESWPKPLMEPAAPGTLRSLQVR